MLTNFMHIKQTVELYQEMPLLNWIPHGSELL